MRNKKRMKSSAKIVISLAALLILVSFIWIFTRPKETENHQSENHSGPAVNTETDNQNTSAPAADTSDESITKDNTGSQAQLIENQGDLEIIVPEDQGSAGF